MSKISHFKPKVKLSGNEKYYYVQNVVKQNQLHTICESGKCPNKSECWGRGTATFMILGEICTRSCKFCAVKHGKPQLPNREEIEALANTIKLMQLKHAVITSVTRDDLPDGGADFWYQTIKRIKEVNSAITIETLIPDFKGNIASLDRVIEAHPDIISHNVETVEALSRTIRVQADYRRSLDVLRHIAASGMKTKSGIMIGLGETLEQIKQTMSDIKDTGCTILTIGQYLQPSIENAIVAQYHQPEYFAELRIIGLEVGFSIVESAAEVRSSYRAEQHI
ncbi:MAG: lipoyl synthase [Bacteroidales bacterium]|nr:lipoyl synthase [Bacteroidales bacterium]